MLMKTGFLLLLVAVLQLQVSAEYARPDFIENVITEQPGSRIVSGWQALPGQHPHHAALRLVGPTGGVSGCGGSIVSREWVITAAHCTAGRLTVVVRAGVVNLTNPEYIYETQEWYNHPAYDDSRPQIVQTDDISILKLQRPVKYTRLLKAIRVQPSSEAYRNYDGEQVYTSGHGRTWTNGAVSEILNWVYLRAVSNAACQATYGSALIIDSSICARFFNVTSQSTCQGDSGGPLVHVGSDGVPVLIGVTSFVAGGNFGCHSGLAAGFIRPGPYLSWFKEVTGIDFENLEEDDEEEVPAPPEESEEEDETPAPPEESEEEDETPAPPEESEEEEDETPAPPEESEEDSDSSESDEDCDMSELLKRLQVKVKVKVSLNKYKLKEKEVEKEKEIKKHH